MPYATTAKNLALDAITVDRIRLHSGAPGATGADNQLGAGLSAATFNAAASGERALNAGVEVTGLAANQSVTHFSLWLDAGAVFRGGFSITSGDVTANASGVYTLATGTKMTATDPA